jgi:hypothetical protein
VGGGKPARGRENAGTIAAPIRSFKRLENPVNSLERRKSRPRCGSLDAFASRGNYHFGPGVRELCTGLLHLWSG